MNLAFGYLPSAARIVTLQFAPLAVPLRVDIADAKAADAVASACRPWKGKAGPGPALHLRIETSKGLSGVGRTTMAVDGATVAIAGPGVTAGAELDRGTAHCELSADYLADPHVMFREVFEPLVLMLLSRRDRTPLHASGFIIDGLAVLLAGRSGAGKSCLARAADQAGFQVLSDDAVFVQLEPRLTVWGWPTAAHLLARDAPDPAAATRLRGGKRKHVVALRSASPEAVACRQAVLCLLTHPRAEQPALTRIAPATAEALLWPLDEGFDLLAGSIARVVARLSGAGSWELHLSSDPAAAVRLLAASVALLRDTAAR